MEHITIRSINIAEHRDIADELVGALHESELELNPRTAHWPMIRKHYLNFLQECQETCQGTFLLAEDRGVAIGFLFGYVVEQEDSNFEIGDDNDLYVSEGYVKPDYRKQGIYTLLNQTFETRYKDFPIRKIYRYTLYNNDKMQHWLSKQGYKPIRLVYEKWLK
ncbi:hypothetical protein DBR32_14960 [Taibaiella sp. KBW10]|uniref:GNAT family N-acetyltransferase n=1 Tax=Taibaiella sp. KBW10 TaxID=2153357 RepID=UPI000F5A5D59|nr:GNAT family N-acetyltransferase [Taibaiella sp. KBW10]RQO29875.1 hypothetical protein DBR32_14960 [Taibaiella sp. KBW10]